MPQSARDTTVSHVAGLLTRRFPRVSAGHVTETVAAEYDALAGSPIRTYVSNLVEHAARSRLVEESALAP